MNDFKANIAGPGFNAAHFAAKNGIDLPFQLYIPEKFDEAKKYPVLFFMPGNGSRGSDNKHLDAPYVTFVKGLTAGKYKNDIIIISPQCAKGNQWVNRPPEGGNYIFSDEPTPYLAAAIELFDTATAALPVDEDRFYLYGNSMGAFASFDLTARFPGRYAAAIPVAGAGDPSKAPLMTKTAFRIFHGRIDKLVPVESSISMYDAIKAAGGNAEIEIYEGYGHNLFADVGKREELADWMMNKRAMHN